MEMAVFLFSYSREYMPPLHIHVAEVTEALCVSSYPSIYSVQMIQSEQIKQQTMVAIKLF